MIYYVFVVLVVASLPGEGEVVQAGEGVLDAGADFAVGGMVLLYPGRGSQSGRVRGGAG